MKEKDFLVSILSSLKEVKEASRKLVGLSDSLIKEILGEIADSTWDHRVQILRANEMDLSRMNPEDPKYDRLLLNEKRLASICEDLRKVAALPSPLGITLDETIRPNGLRIKRVSVPLGVIGIIFESRPNVTFDVVALCLKSGNACVLKGSRDAHESNTIIVSIIQEVLSLYGLQDTVYLAPSEREALLPILEADSYIDCVIPRGSQSLIEFVRKNARVPVIETGAGIVHTYLDERADLLKAEAIIQNAKTRRVSVCNALDCLIIHEKQLQHLPELVKGMDVIHQVLIHADEKAHAVLAKSYDPHLLVRARKEDFGIEWLSYKMSVKTVANLDEALDHIAEYSSRHSEAIISEIEANIERFLTHVDAACVYANASTAFSDGGEFGLGAEIGISTQKLHARGPMGLREMTSYKWIVSGDGQIRN